MNTSDRGNDLGTENLNSFQAAQLGPLERTESTCKVVSYIKDYLGVMKRNNSIPFSMRYNPLIRQGVGLNERSANSERNNSGTFGKRSRTP